MPLKFSPLRGGWSGVATPFEARGHVDADTAALLRWTAAMWVSLIYLQKFALPAGSEALSVTLLALLGGGVYAAITGILKFSRARLFWFAAHGAACALSLVFAPTVSWFSLGLLLGLIALFTLRRSITGSAWAAIVRQFLTLMLLPAAIALAQRAFLSVGVGDVLNLERWVPSAFMLPGYLYAAEFGWKSGVIRPNGFFFLEPSYASAYLAAAAVLEWLTFRRRWAVTLFAMATLATFGATGMLMLAIATAAIACRFYPLPAVIAGAGGLAVVIVFGQAYPEMATALRLNELTDENSSGFGRLALPLVQLANYAVDPSFWVSGLGPGAASVLTDDVGSAWPLLKLTCEYGLLAALTYVALIATACRRARLPLLALPVMVIFQFTGGYLLQPAWIGPVLLLCTLFDRDDPTDPAIDLSDADVCGSYPPAQPPSAGPGRTFLSGTSA